MNMYVNTGIGCVYRVIIDCLLHVHVVGHKNDMVKTFHIEMFLAQSSVYKAHIHVHVNDVYCLQKRASLVQDKQTSFQLVSVCICIILRY